MNVQFMAIEGDRTIADISCLFHQPFLLMQTMKKLITEPGIHNPIRTDGQG